MKQLFIILSGIVLLLAGCDDWVSWDGHTIESAEYTGVNTARIIYKSMQCDTSLYNGDVWLYNKDYIKTYKIISESSHKVWDRNKYYVDITVKPNWEPGDHVWVDGHGYFQSSAEFDVPEK